MHTTGNTLWCLLFQAMHTTSNTSMLFQVMHTTGNTLWRLLFQAMHTTSNTSYVVSGYAYCGEYPLVFAVSGYAYYVWYVLCCFRLCILRGIPSGVCCFRLYILRLIRLMLFQVMHTTGNTLWRLRLVLVMKRSMTTWSTTVPTPTSKTHLATQYFIWWS